MLGKSLINGVAVEVGPADVALSLMLYAVLAIVAMIHTANLPLYISSGKDSYSKNN